MWIFRLHNCAFHTSFWSLELDRNRKEHFYWMVALILHKGLLMIGNCQGTLLPMPAAYFAVSKLKVDHLFFFCSSTKKIRIQILQISNVHGKVGSWKSNFLWQMKDKRKKKLKSELHQSRIQEVRNGVTKKIVQHN